jgi:hypothetical protein
MIRVMPSEQAYRFLAGTATVEIACEDEWATIATAEGGDYSNTVFTYPPSIVPIRKLRLLGLTLNRGGTLNINDDEARASLCWADSCVLIGNGHGAQTDHPISDYSNWAGAYYTDCIITQLGQATSGAKLCRGLQISHIHDDAFQNVPLVINCSVDDVDPLDLGAHADVWQFGGGNEQNRIDHNVIVYGLRATNAHYHSLFIRPDPTEDPPSCAQGMAFVNVFIDLPYPNPDWLEDPQNSLEVRPYGGWFRWVNHLLWWNMSLTTYGMGVGEVSIRDFSCIGCNFAQLVVPGNPDIPYLNDDPEQWEGWENNHFVWPQESYGFTTRGDPLTMTTGDDMLNAGGVPRLGSPLLRRFDPGLTVPVDATNYPRTGLADVGAYQSHVGWTRKYPANSPSARAYHAMAYNGQSDKVLLFGGSTAAGDNGEIWEWDGTTQNWAPRSMSYSPPAQHGHAMVGVGGPLTVVGCYGGEMWDFVLHGSIWAWWPISGAPQRQYGAAVYEWSGLAYVFGGRTPSGEALDDTWIFAEFMSQQLPLDPVPPARWGHAMETSFSPDKFPAILFGGENEQQLFGDTWAFWGGDSWLRSSFLAAMGRAPEPIVLGAGVEGWVELAPTVSPSARSDARIADNVLFGGYGDLPGGGQGLLGDTWVFVAGDPPTWRQVALPAPDPRRGHAMVWDISRNVIILFGGETADGPSDETWELDLGE